jgi:hypothetical protein
MYLHSCATDTCPSIELPPIVYMGVLKRSCHASTPVLPGRAGQCRLALCACGKHCLSRAAGARVHSRL